MIDVHKYFSNNNLNKDNIYDYLDDVAKLLNGRNIYEVMLHLEYLFQIDFDKMLNYFDKHDLKIKYNSVAMRLVSMKRKDLVIKYYDYFIRNNHKLLELKNYFKKHSIKIKPINDLLRKNPTLIFNEIVLSSGSYLETIRKEKAYEFILELIKELLRYEGKTFKDIEYISRGSVSTVYQIGNKILKIGKQRNNFYLNNNKLFLKPLIRKEIYSLDNKEFLYCIEITEKLDMKHITNEDVYQIYKQMRDEGYIWTDPQKSNIGRLIRDNRIYFDNIHYVDKINTGYNDDNDEVMKKGSILYADNEYIYEYEINKYNPFITHFLKENKYEIRYQNELSKKMSR